MTSIITNAQTVVGPIIKSARRVRRVRRCRPFMIVDGMVLTAAVAVGLAASRGLLAQSPTYISGRGRTEVFWSAKNALADGCPGFLLGEIVMLMSGTFALLLLRLRVPRPHVRVMLRQPGSAALCVVTATIPIFVLIVGLAWAVKSILDQYGLTGVDDADGALGELWILGAGMAGLATLSVWLFLGLSRLRLPEPGWIDAGGRALGALWVVHGVGVIGVAIFFEIIS